MGHVQTSRLIPAPIEDVFAYIADFQNVPEMLGGKIHVEFPMTLPAIEPQAEFQINMTRFSISAHIIARIEHVEAPKKFVYRQVSGVFKSWSHVMLLDKHDDKQTRLTDIVTFTLPGGPLGALADDLFVRGDISRLLSYRAAKIVDHFAAERFAAAPTSNDTTEKTRPTP